MCLVRRRALLWLHDTKVSAWINQTGKRRKSIWLVFHFCQFSWCTNFWSDCSLRCSSVENWQYSWLDDEKGNSMAEVSLEKTIKSIESWWQDVSRWKKPTNRFLACTQVPEFQRLRSTPCYCCCCCYYYSSGRLVFLLLLLICPRFFLSSTRVPSVVPFNFIYFVLPQLPPSILLTL
jgi:hypothetical protein